MSSIISSPFESISAIKFLKGYKNLYTEQVAIGQKLLEDSPNKSFVDFSKSEQYNIKKYLAVQYLESMSTILSNAQVYVLGRNTLSAMSDFRTVSRYQVAIFATSTETILMDLGSSLGSAASLTIDPKQLGQEEKYRLLDNINTSSSSASYSITSSQQEAPSIAAQEVFEATQAKLQQQVANVTKALEEQSADSTNTDWFDFSTVGNELGIFPISTDTKLCLKFASMSPEGAFTPIYQIHYKGLLSMPEYHFLNHIEAEQLQKKRQQKKQAEQLLQQPQPPLANAIQQAVAAPEVPKKPVSPGSPVIEQPIEAPKSPIKVSAKPPKLTVDDLKLDFFNRHHAKTSAQGIFARTGINPDMSWAEIINHAQNGQSFCCGLFKSYSGNRTLNILQQMGVLDSNKQIIHPQIAELIDENKAELKTHLTSSNVVI